MGMVESFERSANVVDLSGQDDTRTRPQASMPRDHEARSLWPTRGKRSPPAPPPLAPRGWHERAAAAPEGSGAERDLQEIGPRECGELLGGLNSGVAGIECSSVMLHLFQVEAITEGSCD